MTANELDAEIQRVKTAIAQTQSKYLRRDYAKYLKRLYSKKREKV